MKFGLLMHFGLLRLSVAFIATCQLNNQLHSKSQQERRNDGLQ